MTVLLLKFSVRESKNSNENWHLQIAFLLSEEVYIIQPKKSDANWLICKSISTHKFLSSNYIFQFFFILDQSFVDEVLVSTKVMVHRMNLKDEIIDLFLQKDILRYNLKISVKDPRGKEKVRSGTFYVRIF